jgi:hypothetical protein
MIAPEKAFELAKEKLLKLRTSPLDIKGGVNDCWVFVALYDQYLKEGEGVALPLNLTFNSPLGFYKEIKKLGFNTLPELASYAGWKEVQTLKNGDIGYLKPFCASIYFNGYFYSPRERSILIEKVKYEPNNQIVLHVFRSKEFL